jgi:hypothetical protein
MTLLTEPLRRGSVRDIGELSLIDLAANRDVMHRSLPLSSLPLTGLLGLAHEALNMFS